MDNSPYPINGINGSSDAHSYPSLASFPAHDVQQGSPLPQTLPPLQPSTTSVQPLYGSSPHTPGTGTPDTPNSAYSLPFGYPQSNQAGARDGVYSMAQNLYPPHTGYATSQPVMPGATTAASQPQPKALTPAGGRDLPVLRPMPPGGLMGQNGVGSPYGPGPLMSQNENKPPTRVVGSQGRRGILPNTPGRPAAPAAGTSAAKNTVMPVKDADGKFPCPYCTKTYLHLKHLKRHLLRHTGDRPHMCVLCRDTFSRSDILKRHFQKCSIRRGNPTGASVMGDSQPYGDVHFMNGQSMHGYGTPPGQSDMSTYGTQNNTLESSLDWLQTFPPGVAAQNYCGNCTNKF